MWRRRVRRYLNRNGEFKNHNNDVEVESDEGAVSMCGIEIIAHEGLSEEP